MNKVVYSDKYQLIIKPTQSGKTFIVLSEIKKLFIENKNDTDQRVVNILFCDNSLLQTDQLKNRLESELPIFTDIDGEQSVILSSKSDIKNYACLFTVIYDDDCNNIITCANDVRVEQISQLMENRLKKKDLTTKFYLWIDESDKTFSNRTHFLKKWEKFQNIEKISFITATPEEHFKNQFDEINVLKLENSYNIDIYHLFSKSNFNYVEVNNSEYSLINYISNIIENIATIKNSDVWFVPGTKNIYSHEQIKSYFIAKEFYVFLINGTHKALYDNSGNELERLDVSNDEIGLQELSKKLGLLYEKYNLINEKVVITGNLCISRGITISSEKMLLSHAIIPFTITDHSTAYQLAGRLCGNFKNLPNFKVPTIYITEKLKNIICKMEEIAIKIPSYDKLSFDEYFKLKLDLFNIIVQKFSNIEELIKFYKKELKNIFGGTGPKKNRFTKNNEGFMECIIRSDKKVYTNDEINQNKRWGINKTNKWRCHIGYDSLEDSDTPTFWLIYIDPKELDNIDSDDIIVDDVNNENNDNNNKKLSVVKNKICRPKNINFFNSDTLLLHKKNAFTEYGVFIKEENKIYTCNDKAEYDIDSKYFESLNSFTCNNFEKNCPNRTKHNNAYNQLEYYDKSENIFKKLKFIKDGDILN